MWLLENFKLHISFAFRACIIFLLSRDGSRALGDSKWIISKQYELRKKKTLFFFNYQLEDAGGLKENSVYNLGVQRLLEEHVKATLLNWVCTKLPENIVNLQILT